MARLCPRPDTGRGKGRQVQSALDSPSANLCQPDRRHRHPRGLPRLLSGTQGARVQRQHDTHRPRVAARLHPATLRQCRTLAMDTARIEAPRSLADERTGPRIGGRLRHASRALVRHSGSGNRGEGRGDPRPDMGSGGLRSRYGRLQAHRTAPDEQAAHSGADECNGPSGAYRGLQRPPKRSRDRVWGKARCERQESGTAAFRADGHSIFAARIAAHLRGVDGTGQRADADDFAVPRAYQLAHDRAGLREVQPFIYAGCERRHGVLRYTRTFGAGRYTGLSACFAPWAVTGSNR